MKRMLEKKYLASKQQIQSLLDGYSSDVASTKKIYCHPIKLYGSEGNYIFRLSCLIFDNNKEAYTFDTFKTFVDDLKTKTEGRGAIIMNGTYFNGSTVTITSYFQKDVSNQYMLVGNNASSGAVVNISSANILDIFPTDKTAFYDGVNAIN